MSGAAPPGEAPGGALTLHDRDAEPRTPMKRLGSTRKLAAFSNIRIQLSEQTRVLEARAEAASGVAGELSDYCRRRADLEHDYARALDKLARAAQQRHKDQKHKREQWPLTGAFACWQAALENTRALSRDHAALGELYGGPLAARLQRAADDALRLHRKCRDIVAERHEEVGSALAEAGAAGKAHGAAAAEWRAAALKLRRAHDQRLRLAADHPPKHKKMKALDKELEKRRVRHSEARARALRARADYALSLEAANATLQRYCLDDIADIMLCTEVGFEAVVSRAVRCAGAAEEGRARAALAAGGALLAAGGALDALADRQRVIDHHAHAFQPVRPLPYHHKNAHKQDSEIQTLIEGAAELSDEAAEAVAAELRARLAQLEAAARSLRAECRESAKTLDAAEAELVRQMEGSDEQWDVSRLFGASGSGSAGALAADEPDPRRDQEDYYLAKFRAYVGCAGRLARVEARASAARAQLGAGGPEGPPPSPPSPPLRAAARARRGRFAAPLDGRLPAVLTSCVRVIASYGLKHQGVFRVSGSQVEMQSLRAAFERGEDPLAAARDASDVNTVCGLLKLFLRELRPPLVPRALQADLLRLAAAPDDAAFVRRLRHTLAALPQPNMLVLRYLFAFLAHLAEYSEFNMMDAWNLAICLGPTLLAAWGEGGAQVAAQNLVNELVKRAILHHDELFPQDVAPHTLYTRQFPQPEEAADEPDSRDDLSLYDDDDDEISEDGESGEWQDSNSADNRAASGAERRPSAAQEPASPAPEPSTSAAHARRLAESTPDLVLDLPARAAAAAAQPSPSPTPAPDAPAPAPDASASAPTPADAAADSADTFLHNRDTLKKRPPARRTPGLDDSGAESDGGASTEAACEEGGAGAGAGAGVGADLSDGADGSGGSPVPARNTARVAAKFADLTLTGGSLKPALAAKPALLRRPTPHPRGSSAAGGALAAAPVAPPTVPADATAPPGDAAPC